MKVKEFTIPVTLVINIVKTSCMKFLTRVPSSMERIHFWLPWSCSPTLHSCERLCWVDNLYHSRIPQINCYLSPDSLQVFCRTKRSVLMLDQNCYVRKQIYQARAPSFGLSHCCVFTILTRSTMNFFSTNGEVWIVDSPYRRHCQVQAALYTKKYAFCSPALNTVMTIKSSVVSR